MAPRTRPKGIKDIEQKLGRAVERMGDGADRGLVKGGLLVKRAGQQNTPVRLGNLRASAYVVNKTGDKGAEEAFTGKDGPDVASLTRSEKQLAQGLSAGMDARGRQNVVVGFGAGYAVFVHENANAGAAGYVAEDDTPGKTAKDVHSKVGGFKFLEKALQSQRASILRAIAEETKV